MTPQRTLKTFLVLFAILATAFANHDGERRLGAAVEEKSESARKLKEVSTDDSMIDKSKLQEAYDDVDRTEAIIRNALEEISKVPDDLEEPNDKECQDLQHKYQSMLTTIDSLKTELKETYEAIKREIAEARQVLQDARKAKDEEQYLIAQKELEVAKKKAAVISTKKERIGRAKVEVRELRGLMKDKKCV